MVGDGAGVLEPLGLDQDHLELGGGVDVDHAVAAFAAVAAFLVVRVRAAEAAVVVHHLGPVVDVLIVVAVILAEKSLFNILHERHRYRSFNLQADAILPYKLPPAPCSRAAEKNSSLYYLFF